MIPDPHYTLISTSRGDVPAVVVVNSALRTFKDRSDFSWHLKLTITCKFVGANGMPTRREIDALTHTEQEICKALKVGEGVLFLARITCGGTRELLYRAHNPEATNEVLQQLISDNRQLREWEFHMEQDVGWKLAEPELELLEQDPRFN